MILVFSCNCTLLNDILDILIFVKNIIYEAERVNMSVQSPQTAEVMAIRAALTHALSLGWTRICIKSYSQNIIRSINMGDQIKKA